MLLIFCPRIIQNPTLALAPALTPALAPVPDAPEPRPDPDPAAPAPAFFRARQPSARPLPPGLSLARREIWYHLAGLRPDPGWPPERDAALAGALFGGRKLARAAADLGVEPAAASARFRLISAPIRCPRSGHPTIPGQADLAAVLALRAQPQGGAAA